MSDFSHKILEWNAWRAKGWSDLSGDSNALAPWRSPFTAADPLNFIPFIDRYDCLPIP